MKKLCIFLFVIIFFIPIVAAGDISFSVDQKEYYFKTGENALIPLKIENSYGKQINGLLTYIYTQEINQGGFSMSSSNSQSTSFSIKVGESSNGLDFGTFDSPTTLNINLKFSYSENESRIVNLDSIKIHFVSNESQKQNKQDQQTSSSAKNQQNPISQLQKQLDQMRRQPQNPKQTLQNNQMPQDSSALKKQMEEQFKDEQRKKEEFQKELAQNPDFQREHKELLDLGYNLTNVDLSPSSNNTGEFNLDYKKENEDRASLQGNMENGEMQSIQKNTAEDRENLLKELRENKEFQKYQNQLQKEGYSQQSSEFKQNNTNIQVNYLNSKNETATINADIINNTIQNVKLSRNNINKKNYLVFLIPLFGILGYILYKKLKKKPKQNVIEKIKTPFDYKLESLKMLKSAEKLFDERQYKNAYGGVGQSLRLYLSYNNNLKKEMTNDEIIKHLKKHKKPTKDIKNCFDLCSLVEFAKYDANKKDFSMIVSFAKKIIK